MVEERSGAQGGLGDVPGADLPLGFPYAGACLAVAVACGSSRPLPCSYFLSSVFLSSGERRKKSFVGSVRTYICMYLLALFDR